MKTALLALLLCPAIALARPWWLSEKKANDADFLPPDAAFRVSSVIDGNLIRVRWIIADGYYLYRSKFDIKPESPGLALDPAIFPSGVSRTDEYFGTQEIFKQQAEGVVSFKQADAGAHPPQIRVTYQGCAEAGLCYPPLVKVLSPEIPTASSDAMAEAAGLTATASVPPAGNPEIAFGILGGSLAFFLAGAHLRRKHDASAL